MKHIEAVEQHYLDIMPSLNPELIDDEQREIMYHSPEGWYVRAREMGRAVLNKIKNTNGLEQ